MLRVGTRRSPLALAQAGEIVRLLETAGIASELVPLATAGDAGASPTSPGPAGRKGSFVGEIVQALLAGDIDVAVHSAKDLPAQDPHGVVTAAVPERADPLDVLVTSDGALPDGAVVGTSSLRRRTQLLRWRPDVRVEDLRGNVDTRLRRLEEGVVDGLLLAAAGISRLGLRPAHTQRLEIDLMLPAPGQGALAVQIRTDDPPARRAILPMDHPASRTAFEAERGVVRALGADCALPLGAYAEASGGRVRLRALVTDGSGAAARADVTGARAADAAAAAVAALLDAGAGPMLAAAGGGPK